MVLKERDGRRQRRHERMESGPLSLGSILIVDDDPAMRLLLETLLGKLGFEMDSASDGEDALRRVKARHFDLVISDLKMPGLDGIELLEAIKAAGLDTEVLIISAVSSIPTAVEAVKLGAINYVQKPIDPKALKEEVRAIFRNRRSKPSAPAAPARSPRTPPATGQMIGRYRLRDRLGVGAMAVVYAAFDPNLQRTVAVKVFQPSRLLNPEQEDELLQRFHREARAVGQLTHPNIAPIYDFAKDAMSDAMYFVMEWVAGTDLSALLASETKLPVEQVIRIVYQIADALEFAHARSIIHRDVKPSNIIVGVGDFTKVLDFGVAWIPHSELTRIGNFVGSPAYLSPEMVRGEPVDYRSDQFSLGSVMFEMLAGQKAFYSDQLVPTLENIANKDHPRLGELGLAVPPEVHAILDTLLEKLPQDRYADEMELLGDLEEAGEMLGMKMRPAVPRQR